ncbi:hypothetical protein COPEUT_02851 [Coprococcus eutactus ATCC 27759]|nr:hypothetical protein COPEUT_02851 [Coprococcus eutactus ATCC 27759]
MPLSPAFYIQKGTQNDIVLCPFALTLTLYDLFIYIASLFFS